jgi:hypothetical protein
VPPPAPERLKERRRQLALAQGGNVLYRPRQGGGSVFALHLRGVASTVNGPQPADDALTGSLLVEP